MTYVSWMSVGFTGLSVRSAESDEPLVGEWKSTRNTKRLKRRGWLGTTKFRVMTNHLFRVRRRLQEDFQPTLARTEKKDRGVVCKPLPRIKRTHKDKITTGVSIFMSLQHPTEDIMSIGPTDV